MAEPVAERSELADALVQLVGLRGELVAVDARLAVRVEHASDLVEGEAGVAPERDQGEALDHARIELAAQTDPADRLDQAAFFVITDRGRRDAHGPAHFADVHLTS